VKVSLGANDAPDISLIAGFDQSGVGAADQNLLNAHDYASKKAAKQEGSLSQYYLTIKNRLKTSSNAKLKRLLMVVEDHETKTLVTQLPRENREPDGE
jgi:hypothetical protein